jgi:N-acyl-D-aspartate/D-glutamate deacylase
MELMPELKTRPPETEKITVNLGLVDLGQVDLLVQEGFYSNRTDFIRTALRNQLLAHAEPLRQSVARRTLTLGLHDYSRADLERARGSGEEDLVHGTGWDGIVVASAAGHPEAEGRSIQELSDERGCRPAEAACDLIAAARARVMVVLHSMSPDDVAAIRAWPRAMIGSDGLPFPGRQHPRVAGALAKVMGEAARAGTLADAVHRNTAMATDRFAIPDRGVVRAGAVADLVVLDPSAVADRATYEDPWAAPAGIEHVLLAGRHAVRDGEPTGIRAGAVLTPA